GIEGHRRQNSCELDLQLHVPIEIQVPVEAVLIVTDSRNEADYEATTAAHLATADEQVDVLPQDPVVLFMHADRVLDHPRPALLVGERGVEVVDLAEAVAA